MKQIPMFKTAVSPEAADAVKAVLDSGMLGEGPQVEAFIQKLRAHYGLQNVIPLNSGTSALTLALRLFGVGSGDKVLTTPFTMVATSCAIAANGAECLWYDPTIEYLIAAPEEIEPLMAKASALMVTIVGGMVPCAWELEKLRSMCKEHGIPFIIDGAHAFNSRIDNLHIAKYCDAFCASFQAIKHLCCAGDGGALVLNDNLSSHVYEKAERLKWFGMTRIVPEGKTRLEHQMTTDVPEWGYKAHMNDVAASVGIANWNLALENEKKSRDNALFYQKRFEHLDGDKINLFPNNTSAISSWWIYGFLASKRDELIAYLERNGITSTPMWRMNHLYSAFNKPSNMLSRASRIAKEIIFIPNGFWVTDEDRNHIVKTIEEFYK